MGTRPKHLVLVGDLAEQLGGGDGDLPVVTGAVRHVVCGKGFVVQGVGLTDATNILKEINL